MTHDTHLLPAFASGEVDLLDALGAVGTLKTSGWCSDRKGRQGTVLPPSWTDAGMSMELIIWITNPLTSRL